MSLRDTSSGFIEDDECLTLAKTQGQFYTRLISAYPIATPMVTVDISIELKEQYYQAFLYNFSLRVGDTVCNQLATLFFLNPHYFNAHAY